MLVTGYDILFFWVARMMMFGLYAMADRARTARCRSGTSPCTAWSATSTASKMSKSRGNTVDPLDWIDRFGADATRFTLARGASPGGDVAISEEWVAGRAELLQQAVERHPVRAAERRRPSPGTLPRRRRTCPTADRWILSRLAAVTAEVDALFEDVRVRQGLRGAVPLRLGRGLRLVPGAGQGRRCNGGPTRPPPRPTRRVLGYVLDRLLRLLHPVMPFVTEALWTALTGGESVMIAAWPGSGRPARPRAAAAADPAAEAEIGSLMRLVTEVRRFRSDQGLRPGQPVPARLAGIAGTAAGRARGRDPGAAAARPPAGTGFAPTASLHAEGVTVELDTAAAIDVAAERRRLEKDLAAAQKEADQARTQARATTPSSPRRPPTWWTRPGDRLAAAQADIARLTGRLAALGQARRLDRRGPAAA